MAQMKKEDRDFIGTLVENNRFPLKYEEMTEEEREKVFYIMDTYSEKQIGDAIREARK